jgi:hypothetical protein
MRISEYNAYFKSLAEKHVDIRHSDTECHFARITLVGWPSREIELTEFIQKQQRKLKPPFMLLESADWYYGDNAGDNRNKLLQGAFIILDKAKGDDFDQQEQVYDKTEEIGEDLIGAACKYFRETDQVRKGAIFDLNDQNGTRVERCADGFYGNRFEFTIRLNANQALKYKSEKFVP